MQIMKTIDKINGIIEKLIFSFKYRIKHKIVIPIEINIAPKRQYKGFIFFFKNNLNKYLSQSVFAFNEQRN